MSDLISREDAIKALGERPCGDTDWDLGCRNQWDWDTEILRTLPSAEPEPKKGKWIEINGTSSFIWLRCSECGYGANGRTNFCPNCGAYMRGEL